MIKGKKGGFAMICNPSGGGCLWSFIFPLGLIKAMIEAPAEKKLERNKKLIYDEALQTFHEGELTVERREKVTTELVMKYKVSRKETGELVSKAYALSGEWRKAKL